MRLGAAFMFVLGFALTAVVLQTNDPSLAALRGYRDATQHPHATDRAGTRRRDACSLWARS